MKCAKCEQEINNSKFCPSCGNYQEIKIPQKNLTELEHENQTVEAINNSEPIEENKNNKNNIRFYIIFSLVVISALGIFIYIIIQYLNPKITINQIKKEYQYSEILTNKFTVSGNLFIKEENTNWLINGYKFSSGKTVENLPIVIGDNVLTINNNGASKTYYFTVINDMKILSDGNYSVATDYLDFDQDGIPNLLESENETSTNSIDSDNDELFDNVELIMNLDPTKQNEYDEIREYKVIQDNDKSSKNYALINAKGNVANTFLDSVDLNIGFSNFFIQSDVLRITTTNIEQPESMEIFFIKDTKWNTKDYSIYTFNEYTDKIEELKTSTNGNYFTAKIAEFDQVYFVGKKDQFPKKYLNQIIILIDNSGSMFPKDYVVAKTNSIADDSSYNHDSEFKRLSLMNSLVDKLGTDNYEYSVYAFTANYCDMISNSTDANKIKKSINSLKTECQKFNGTDMSGAIKKYANTFKTDVYGAKYMIVLTDGKDTGNNEFNLSEYYLNNYRKQGIHIITLGLSSNVNSEYLMNIAQLTKGKYLFASDANMLDELAETIESSIDNTHATIKRDKKEYVLIADSGFQVNRDGFSFKDFGSEDSPNSNSYGFSYFAKQLYLNKVFSENGQSDIVKTKLTDINKERLVKGKIFNINLSDTYKTQLYNSESLINLSELNNQDDDYQLLNIINNSFKTLKNRFVSKINDYVLKQFQKQFYDYDDDINKIIDELQSGSPAILTLISSAGNHSVLATKIYKAKGTDEYIINVYDSNIPGEEGEIHLKRLTAYYEFAKTSYYAVNYNEYNINFNTMLYIN